MPNMGMKAVLLAPSGLAAALFSGTRQWLFGLLFAQPSRSFYANELIELAGSGSGAAQRELASLTHSGLVNVRPVGQQVATHVEALGPPAGWARRALSRSRHDACRQQHHAATVGVGQRVGQG